VQVDTVIVNGRLLDAEGSALAIAGERIVAVGSDEEVNRLRGPRTEVIDAVRLESCS
jgi:predicted amidohydrolase YtcJ